MKIKIDGEVFDVPEKVVQMFDKLTNDRKGAEKQVAIHANAIKKANEMLDNCLYLLERIEAGEDISRKDGELMWETGRRLKFEYEAEARSGLIGWLMGNWSKICAISCDCGALINYDAVRLSSQLICKQCFEANNKIYK